MPLVNVPAAIAALAAAGRGGGAACDTDVLDLMRPRQNLAALAPPVGKATVLSGGRATPICRLRDTTLAH
jgi:hypothetical protein